MHIYAFGSICRGQVDRGSDIDLLAIVEGRDERFDPEVYSIYSYDRIKEIWREGNPFAWHLAHEAVLLFAEDKRDFLASLETPAQYKNVRADCEKFHSIFSKARNEFSVNSPLAAFLLSTMFLGYRNFATCYSLGTGPGATFSRNSALELGENSLDVDPGVHMIFADARLLCTRGIGAPPNAGQQEKALRSAEHIEKWMTRLSARL